MWNSAFGVGLQNPHPARVGCTWSQPSREHSGEGGKEFPGGDSDRRTSVSWWRAPGGTLPLCFSFPCLQIPTDNEDPETAAETLSSAQNCHGHPSLGDSTARSWGSATQCHTDPGAERGQTGWKSRKCE